MAWYERKISVVVDDLKTDTDRGLSDDEARERLAEHGPNALAEARRVSPLLLFLSQFKNSLLIILLLGAALSLYTGHLVDAIAITFLVFFNATISFVQEIKAQQSLDALKEMPRCCAAGNGTVSRQKTSCQGTSCV